jgi:hypothetical protein
VASTLRYLSIDDPCLIAHGACALRPHGNSQVVAWPG